MAKEAKPAPTRAGAALLDQLDHDPDAKRKFAVFCGKVAAAVPRSPRRRQPGKKFNSILQGHGNHLAMNLPD